MNLPRSRGKTHAHITQRQRVELYLCSELPPLGIFTSRLCLSHDFRLSPAAYARLPDEQGAVFFRKCECRVALRKPGFPVQYLLLQVVIIRDNDAARCLRCQSAEDFRAPLP